MDAKKKGHSPVVLELFCEWSDCSEQFSDLTEYLQHLTGHANEQMSQHGVEVDSLTCNWQGCGETEFSGQSEFRLHLSFHGFHHKLMSFGLKVMKELAEQHDNPNLVCSLDGASRNVLPQLPAEFVCGWVDCFTTFHDAESFYRHVDTHAFDNVVIPSLSKEVLKKTRFAGCSWVNCQASFVSRSHLKEHLRSHTQEKLMACPGCGAMFSTRSKFADHLFRQVSMANKTDAVNSFTFHVQNSKEEDQMTTLTIQMPQTNSPGIDAQRSIILQNLNGDNEMTIIDLTDQMVTVENRTPVAGKTFPCPSCNSEFASRSLLKEHARRHATNHRCSVCGLCVVSPSALRHHMTYRHKTERPFACQFCEYRCKSKSDLRKHIDTHNEEDPYKCSVCNFHSRCAHTVVKHHKEVHEDCRSAYICNECDKPFSRGNNLTRHLVTTHKYSLPPGQSRFQYQKHADGNFRLITKSLTGRSVEADKHY